MTSLTPIMERFIFYRGLKSSGLRNGSFCSAVSSMRILIAHSLGSSRRGLGVHRRFAGGDYLLRSIGQRVGADAWYAALPNDPAAGFDIGPGKTHHEGNVDGYLSTGLHNALSNPITPVDSGEDVDKDRAHVAVGQHEPQGGRNAVRRSTTADVEKVGRATAGMFDHVHGCHRQPGSIDNAADLAFEADIVQIVLRGLCLARVLLGRIVQVRDVVPPEECVVIECHLGVECNDAVILGEHERIDLEHRRVAVAEGPVSAHDRRHCAGHLLMLSQAETPVRAPETPAFRRRVRQ